MNFSKFQLKILLLLAAVLGLSGHAHAQALHTVAEQIADFAIYHSEIADSTLRDHTHPDSTRHSEIKKKPVVVKKPLVKADLNIEKFYLARAKRRMEKLAKRIKENQGTQAELIAAVQRQVDDENARLFRKLTYLNDTRKDVKIAYAPSTNPYYKQMQELIEPVKSATGANVTQSFLVFKAALESTSLSGTDRNGVNGTDRNGLKRKTTNSLGDAPGSDRGN